MIYFESNSFSIWPLQQCLWNEIYCRSQNDLDLINRTHPLKTCVLLWTLLYVDTKVGSDTFRDRKSTREIGICHGGDHVVPALRRGCSNQIAPIYPICLGDTCSQPQKCGGISSAGGWCCCCALSLCAHCLLTARMQFARSNYTGTPSELTNQQTALRLCLAVEYLL